MNTASHGGGDDDVSVALIVAAADNDIIGRDNALPWDLPADLARFKRITMGKPILMGRKTFESIGRPLPGRTNIVVTRDTRYHADGVKVVHSLDAAIALAEDIALISGGDELMVIGGAEIYAMALAKANRIYLTRVHEHPLGDTYLPAINWDEWQETARDEHDPEGGTPGFAFLDYTRQSPRTFPDGSD